MTYTNFQLDSTNNIEIANNNFVLISGVDAIAQACACRLRTFYGEWFLDQREGVPYYQSILGQKPRLAVVGSILRRYILETDGVVGIDDFNISFDSTTRALSLSFTGVADTGTFDLSLELGT